MKCLDDLPGKRCERAMVILKMLRDLPEGVDGGRIGPDAPIWQHRAVDDLQRLGLVGVISPPELDEALVFPRMTSSELLDYLCERLPLAEDQE